MYLIAKENTTVLSNYGTRIKLDLSKIWKVVRTPACKAGEYALFLKDDNDNGSKFTIFQGYVSYDNICKWFELIKYTKEKKGKKDV